jgi:hypothetical protein
MQAWIEGIARVTSRFLWLCFWSYGAKEGDDREGIAVVAEMDTG